MIVTVTPNTSIDKTYAVEGFRLDRINRPTACTTVPGGKGINIVRVLKELHRNAIATGFVGGSIGEAIGHGLDDEGLRHDFVRVEGESRLCIKIMDPTTGTQTELNELGPMVCADDIDRMFHKVAELARGASHIVLSGNCPPGVSTSFYGDLIEIARRAGAKAVLDTSGEHLAEAVKSAPWMVKPNVAELSELAGHELCTLEEICGAAKSLKQFGVEIAAVTMGRSGAMVTDCVQAWLATPPEIQFVSAVGSGDSFVAAFIDSLLSEGSIAEALEWGTAAGAANATSYGAGFCSKESIIDIRQGVTLTRLS